MAEMTKKEMLGKIKNLENKIDELKLFINTREHQRTALRTKLENAKKILE